MKEPFRDRKNALVSLGLFIIESFHGYYSKRDGSGQVLARCEARKIVTCSRKPESLRVIRDRIRTSSSYIVVLKSFVQPWYGITFRDFGYTFKAVRLF